MRHLHAPRLVPIAAVVIAFGCQLPIGETKTDPDNGTGQVKNWSFTISPSHNNFDVQAGTTDTLIMTITRVGGFTGPVNFEIQNPDPGVTVSSEPITTTGAITTTRILTRVNGPHLPLANTVYNLHAAPVSTEVEGQSLDIHYNIVRKIGTFVNIPATLSVGRGQSVVQRVTITRTQYDAAVPFNLINAPAGMTATFSPNPIPGADTVTQMTLTAGASVPEGVYNVGVRANEGIGTFQGTAPLGVTVTPPGSFTFTLSTGTLAVPKNTTVPVGAIIVRTNYSGPITFTVTGVPAGVNIIMNNPATGNNFQISFGNTASSVPGSYQVQVSAAAVGAPSVPPVTLTLNIS